MQTTEITDQEITVTSARERAVIITAVTEMEMAADLAREDLREIAARVDSVETETVMAREDLQDREIPRTEDHVRVMEATVDSVRAKAVTIETETEMAADLVREDHKAARDVSQEKTVTTAMRDALADRITRDSAPAVQEEAAVDLMQCLHRSLPRHPRTASVSVTEKIRIRKKSSIRPQAADTDQTRAAEIRCPESRRLFRSQLHSRSRKRRNQRSRKSQFRRSLPSVSFLRL